MLDGLTSLALGIPSDRRFKELVYAITKHFRALGVTLNMSMETEQLSVQGQLSGYGISFAADNVVQLRYLELDAIWSAPCSSSRRAGSVTPLSSAAS